MNIDPNPGFGGIVGANRNSTALPTGTHEETLPPAKASPLPKAVMSGKPLSRSRWPGFNRAYGNRGVDETPITE